MRIAWGTDEDAEPVVSVVARLSHHGHDTYRVAQGCSWEEVGRSVAEEVASGRAERGVVWCWTGTGVSIAANKVAGVRAALCADALTAAGARRWNDANVVALSLRATSAAVAGEIVDAFVGTEADLAEMGPVERLEPGLSGRGGAPDSAG